MRQENYQSNAAYSLLFLSITSALLLPPEKQKLSVYALIAAIKLGYTSGRIKISGIGALITYAILLGFSFQKQPNLFRSMATILSTLLNVALSSHKVPGFSNQKIISNEIMSAHGVPYNLYLNFDKVSASIITLLFYGAQNNTDKSASLSSVMITALTTILVTLVGALKTEFVALDLSIKKHFIKWGIINLFFVSVPEEVIFRRSIQGSLENNFNKKIALMVSSILFGLAHYTGGKKYIGLATLAGAGYGMIYQKTGSIRFSGLAHFLLNLTHFLCFTYPALDSHFKGASFK